MDSVYNIIKMVRYFIRDNLQTIKEMDGEKQHTTKDNLKITIALGMVYYLMANNFIKEIFSMINSME